MRAVIIPLMLAVVGLAGCADSVPTVVSDDDLPEFEDVQASAGKGLLRGIVIDDTITPIAGATVSIKSIDLETETSENGAFQFVDLDPGTYFMEVHKVGYSKVQAQGNVEAGVANPELVRIQIAVQPGALPAYVPLQYSLFMSCGFKAANYVFDAYYCDPADALGLQGQDDSATLFELGREDKPEHYQSEIIWDANQPLSQGLVTIQCNRDDTTCGSGVGSDRICNVRGSSPLVCRISADTPSNEVPGGGNNFTTIRDGEGWSPQVAVGVYSNCAVTCDPVTGVMGAGLAVDQEVRAFVSLFYNFRPADDWLFIEDGEHPVPE